MAIQHTVGHVVTYRQWRETMIRGMMEDTGASRSECIQCVDMLGEAEYFREVGEVIRGCEVTGAAVRNICAATRNRADAMRYFAHHRCEVDPATFSAYWTRRESRKA